MNDREFLTNRLSKCLNFEVPDDMISYILSMKTADEAEMYFQTLLDFNIPEHRIFFNDYKNRIYGKNPPRDDGNNGKKKMTLLVSSRGSKNDKYNQNRQSNSEEKENNTKKKNKFVNLYGKDGNFVTDSILLKGRHRCNCQASRHKLINNCTKCGRIVCEQENHGPCLFCGNLVCSEEEQKLIDSATKKGDNLKRSLMEQQRPKGWEEAIAQRDRLLEYNRTSKKRTTVIDDESDYFKSNSVWLSDEERKKLSKLEEEVHSKKHASRLDRKIQIDFTGRQILEDETIDNDEILQQISKITLQSNQNSKNKSKNPDLELGDSVHPLLEFDQPVFVSEHQTKPNTTRQNPNFDGVYNRVQDKELLELSDMKSCLSMHQPWASLLVMGIKKHEGRSWYTPHRGRLWIASTAKPADQETINIMEEFYRKLYNDPNSKFPSQYPTGCLLGCVSVEDCLTQEEYREKFPAGESDSPFVFICKDPQDLPIRFPIKGEHKIYKVDASIHTAAVKSLQRVARLKAES